MGAQGARPPGWVAGKGPRMAKRKMAQYEVERFTTERRTPGKGSSTYILDAANEWEAVKAMAVQFRDPHRITRSADRYVSRTASGLKVYYIATAV